MILLKLFFRRETEILWARFCWQTLDSGSDFCEHGDELCVW